MSTVLNCFDAAFVINADSESIRLERVAVELARVGVAFERIPAVTDACPSFRVRSGATATTLSHCAAVKLAQQRRYRNVLIFEDDAVLRRDFLDRWTLMHEEIRRLQYDLLYFYDWSCPRREGVSEIFRIQANLCTHAYAVSGKFFNRYQEILTRYQSAAAIDRILSKVTAQKWAIVPNLAGQASGVSTVYNYHKPLRWSVHDK